MDCTLLQFLDYIAGDSPHCPLIATDAKEALWALRKLGVIHHTRPELSVEGYAIAQAIREGMGFRCGTPTHAPHNPDPTPPRAA